MSEVPTQIELPVISMWQPWASWVAWGWKPIETRTHARFRSLVGKRIGIHAALRFDEQARQLAHFYLTLERLGASDNYPRGIICTAFVREHRLLAPSDASEALIECNTQRYGLFLEAIHRIEPPLRCKGRQGIFRVFCPSTVHGSHASGVSLPKSFVNDIAEKITTAMDGKTGRANAPINANDEFQSGFARGSVAVTTGESGLDVITQEWHRYGPGPMKVISRGPPISPNYSNDLNCCAEFEKGLTDAQCESYRKILADPTVFHGNDYPAQGYLFHATAAQRCLAFIQTMEEKR